MDWYIYDQIFYYIDLLADYFAKNILSDEEKAFNLITLYGKDTSTEQIINEVGIDVTNDEFVLDIQKADKIFLNKLGYIPNLFSYPFGEYSKYYDLQFTLGEIKENTVPALLPNHLNN